MSINHSALALNAQSDQMKNGPSAAATPVVEPVALALGHRLGNSVCKFLHELTAPWQ